MTAPDTDQGNPVNDSVPGGEVTASGPGVLPVRSQGFGGARFVSERQCSGLRQLVHLVARHLREGATAVGLADQESQGADSPGEAAGRVGELSGTAGYVEGQLLRPGEQTVVRVDRERPEASECADDVHGAAGEDQVVPADVGGVGGQVRELDEPADA